MIVVASIRGTHIESRDKRGAGGEQNDPAIYWRRRARDYDGYGCFCIRGGTGTPVDGVDRSSLFSLFL